MDKTQEAVRRIIWAINKIDGVYYYFARHLGINENALTLLYALDDGQIHSQKEISDEWLIPRTTINTIVKNMVSDGYIAFDPEQHTKEKTIMLTEKGRSYADKLMSSIYAAEEKAMKDTVEQFSPEFISALEHFSGCLYGEYSKVISDGQL